MQDKGGLYGSKLSAGNAYPGKADIVSDFVNP